MNKSLNTNKKVIFKMNKYNNPLYRFLKSAARTTATYYKIHFAPSTQKLTQGTGSKAKTGIAKISLSQ